MSIHYYNMYVRTYVCWIFIFYCHFFLIIKKVAQNVSIKKKKFVKWELWILALQMRITSSKCYGTMYRYRYWWLSLYCSFFTNNKRRYGLYCMYSTYVCANLNFSSEFRNFSLLYVHTVRTNARTVQYRTRQIKRHYRTFYICTLRTGTYVRYNNILWKYLYWDVRYQYRTSLEKTLYVTLLFLVPISCDIQT